MPWVKVTYQLNECFLVLYGSASSEANVWISNLCNNPNSTPCHAMRR